MHALAARATLMGLLLLRQLGFSPGITPEPINNDLAQLWIDPVDLEHRDLAVGPNLDVDPPDTSRPLTFVEEKTSGFSPGYDVKDAAGHVWTVKLGPEAQTEVVASRLLWAIGYHQPSIYYIDSWTLVGGPSPGIQTGARFRRKDGPIESAGHWSWQHNPFVGTKPYHGLIVAMLLLNSTDLRNDNNVIYKPVDDTTSTDRWWVVKDLGATFGATGVYRPQRNDIDAFEREPLVTFDTDGHQRLAYHGLQKELLRNLTAADFQWTTRLFERLSPTQLHDAFRAGGYTDDAAARYVAALQRRLHAAEAIDDSFSGRDSDYWISRHVRTVGHALRDLPRHLHP